MNKHLHRIFGRGLSIALSAVALSLVPLADAATFTINPSSISNTYSGSITLQITGLTNGETVLVERFLDLNNNGVVDVADLLVQSFKDTEGQVTSFDGIRDVNVPGDDDGATNASIQTSLSFNSGPEFSRSDGQHLFRVSSPTGRFTPLVRPLTVTQAAFAQRVTGNVTSGGSPVTNASVALLIPVGNDIQFIGGTVADAAGNYSLAAAPGDYVVLAAKPGYVSDLNAAPMITLTAGQVVTTNLTLTAPTHTISGKVSDAASSNGIPGLQLFVESANNTLTFAFSDASGNFTASVLPDQWKFSLSDFGLSQAGYLRPQNKPKVTVSTSDVTGVNIPLAKESALIYGNVKNDTNAPLPGISMFANDGSNQYQASAITDANGNYTLGVSGTTWFIGPDNSNPGLAGYVLQGTNVTLTNGQAVLVNFVAQRSTAHLLGHVTDTGALPVSGLTLLAFPQGGGSSASATTAGDGSFDLGVFGGSWTINLESGSAAQLGVIGPDMTFNVTDGVNISNINYVVRAATTTITGVVTNSNGQPLSNINVSGFITASGTNYSSNAQTDGTGHYQLSAFNGTWQVNLDCSSLNTQGYGCPNQQNVIVSGTNATANFTVQAFSNTPATLTQPQWLPGQFQFQVSGESGRNYRIDVTTDFSTWATLATNTAFGGSFPFSDPGTSNFTRRFYRAVLVP